MTDLPIACTLSQDGLASRLALIDALATDGLLGRAPTATGLRVRLRDTPEIERRTRELVAAESRCCAFSSSTSRARAASWCSTSPVPRTPGR